MRFLTRQPKPAFAGSPLSSSWSEREPDDDYGVLASVGGSGGTSGPRPPSSSGSGGTSRTTSTGGAGSVPPNPGRPGSGRSGGSGGPGGSERSVSYQPEARYWTDYLRIAFPVLGLLLLLGLFWYWAVELIDNNDEPTATTVAQTTPATGITPTGDDGAGGPTLNTVETTPGEGGAGNTTGTEETEPRVTRTPRQATRTPSAVGRFEEDDVVVTNGEANLRSEPALGDNVVTTLEAGTELTVTGESVEEDDYVWVPVVDNDDQSGYIAEDLLDPA